MYGRIHDCGKCDGSRTFQRKPVNPQPDSPNGQRRGGRDRSAPRRGRMADGGRCFGEIKRL